MHIDPGVRHTVCVCSRKRVESPFHSCLYWTWTLNGSDSIDAATAINKWRCERSLVCKLCFKRKLISFIILWLFFSLTCYKSHYSSWFTSVISGCIWNRDQVITSINQQLICLYIVIWHQFSSSVCLVQWGVSQLQLCCSAEETFFLSSSCLMGCREECTFLCLVFCWWIRNIKPVSSEQWDSAGA